jgi:hypothetical protein
MVFRKTLAVLIAGLACSGVYNSALAVENDELDAPLGVWSLDSAILPPSGTYAQIIGAHYEANSVKDAMGNNVQFGTMLPLAPGVSVPVAGTIDAKIITNVVVPRFVYIGDDVFLGGHAGAYVAVPLVDKSREVNVTVTTALPPPYPAMIGAAATTAASGKQRGLGDVEVTSFIGWKQDDLSIVAAFNVDLPTGKFDKTTQVNLGTNYYSFRPLLSGAYSTESGFDVAAAVSYNVSTVNKDTSYKSGQYLTLEYEGTYQFSGNFKAGVQGYYLDQTTDDQDPNGSAAVPIVNGNKARAESIGPVASWQSDDLRTKVEFKYLAETGVRARPQGDLFLLTLTRQF